MIFLNSSEKVLIRFYLHVSQLVKSLFDSIYTMVSTCYIFIFLLKGCYRSLRNHCQPERRREDRALRRLQGVRRLLGQRRSQGKGGLSR